MENTISYIYKVTNTINHKVYIGQSVNPIARLRQHITSRSNKAYLLNYAIKKYGVENFLFEVIRSEVPIEQINETEIQCIKEHNCKVPNGYNITEGGEGLKGHKHSEETKQKIRQAGLGRVVSYETRMKIGLAHKGKTLSEEMKAKLSVSHRGKKQSEETIQKRVAANTGRKRTEEFKKKMSLARTGQQGTMTGKKHSEETKKKIGLANSKHKCKEHLKTYYSKLYTGQKRSDESVDKFKKTIESFTQSVTFIREFSDSNYRKKIEYSCNGCKTIRTTKKYRYKPKMYCKVCCKQQIHI